MGSLAAHFGGQHLKSCIFAVAVLLSFLLLLVNTNTVWICLHSLSVAFDSFVCKFQMCVFQSSQMSTVMKEGFWGMCIVVNHFSFHLFYSSLPASFSFSLFTFCFELLLFLFLSLFLSPFYTHTHTLTQTHTHTHDPSTPPTHTFFLCGAFCSF